MARVCIYTPIYPPERGGAPNYFSGLVASLTEDHDFVIVTAWHPERPLYAIEDDAHIIRVVPRIRSLPRPVRALLEPTVAFLVVLFLRFFWPPDLLHAHSTSLSVVGVALASTLMRLPLVFDCRDANFPHWLVRRGDGVYWLSVAGNVDRRLEAAGIPAERVIRVPVANPDYVLDHRPDGPPAPSVTGLDILFVGRLRAAKGVGTLLKSFRDLRSECPGATLTFVGDGPESEGLAERASKLEGVTFAGQLPHETTLDRIAAADVLVLPSESEGLPRVILEAFDLGTPVVATPVGDVEKLLEDGYNGFLVDATAPDLRNTLERLCGDRELLATLMTGAWESGGTQRWTATVSRVSDIYDRVAPKTPG